MKSKIVSPPSQKLLPIGFHPNCLQKCCTSVPIKECHPQVFACFQSFLQFVENFKCLRLQLIQAQIMGVVIILAWGLSKGEIFRNIPLIENKCVDDKHVCCFSL